MIDYDQYSQITSVAKVTASGSTLMEQAFSRDSHGNLLSMTDANGGNPTNWTYNSAGLPASMTDARGHSYTYQYDTLNRLIQETDPLGNPQSWTYDAASDVTSYTNANGVTDTFTYDLMGRMLTETLPLNATTSATYSFSYDAAGNLTSKTVPLDYNGSTLVTATDSYAYNGLNQLVSATDALGNVTAYSYDPAGNLIGVTNPLGATTTYSYDADNRLIGESVPISGSGASQVSATTSYALDAAGQVTAVTNPLDQTTQYTYNARGWLNSETDPLGNQVLYTYYDTGNVKTKTLLSASGASETWTYTYDVNNNLIALVDPEGNTTRYTYDANNNLLTTSVNGSLQTSNTYNALNQLVSVSDAAGATTQYAYDGVGNLIQETDPLGNVTTYAYNDQNQLVQESDPLAGTTSYAYNLAGWQTSETDPDGNVTSYGYNNAGWLTSETNPLGYSSLYAYNAAGELTDYTDAMGNQTLYSYNEAGWETSETWLNSQGQQTYQATYGYNLGGQLIAAADNNSAYTYSYDAAGNVSQETVTYPGLSSQALVTLNYGYDGLGHVTSLTDSLGGQLTYAYNGDQLTQLGLSLNGVSTPVQLSFAYNNQGLVSAINSQDGAYALRIDYDADNRVSYMSYPNVELYLQYSYNADSQVTSYSGPEGTNNYSYDTTGQLTGVSGAQSASYSYDTNGNRTMSGYVTGPGNQLLSDGTYTYTYNKDGQLATRTDQAGNVWTYSWDNRGRLVEVVETNSQDQVVSDEKLVYDVFNNLIGTIVNGVPQTWTVWNGSNPYLQFDGSGNLTVRYITDPNAANEFFSQVGATGVTEWLLRDQLNSIRMVVDDSGNVLDQINYDSYGNVVFQSNAANAPLYLFQGGYLDSNLALYRFGARWYDPGSGSWISKDPLGLGPDTDPYRFVANDPTNAMDPSGEELVLLGIGITYWIVGAIVATAATTAVVVNLPPGQAAGRQIGRGIENTIDWIKDLCSAVRNISFSSAPPGDEGGTSPTNQPGVDLGTLSQRINRLKQEIETAREVMAETAAEESWEIHEWTSRFIEEVLEPELDEASRLFDELLDKEFPPEP